MAIDNQVLYLGRWVAREFFRAFIYNATGQKLVNSYDEYMEHISGGGWFAEKEAVPGSTDKVVDLKPVSKRAKAENATT